MPILRPFAGSIVFFVITYVITFKLVPFLWNHGSSAGVDLSIVCLLISVVSGFLGLFFFADFVDGVKAKISTIFGSKGEDND